MTIRKLEKLMNPASVVVIVTARVSPELRLSLLKAGRAQCFRVLGPNGIGLLRPTGGLNDSFAHRNAPAGRLLPVGIATQSRD